MPLQTIKHPQQSLLNFSKASFFIPECYTSHQQLPTKLQQISGYLKEFCKTSD
ncbi:hypothetical protein HMPREF9371_2229 [Neisseria shayeganii 871]|uniref:Uncharacterized protein n=1 Tax=Neisseria shayeganii 871 TaxID=1032488 RepID=G4CKT9_9NEIS|nr:hypothetical protein HMPREF9371_2229 [Neisseria shayeganii 871]